MACFASERVVGKLRESQRIASFLCCDASTENASPTAGFLVNLPRVVKLENIVLERNMSALLADYSIPAIYTSTSIYIWTYM